MKAKQTATKITGTVAKPSRPSVKFTALDEPTITKTAKGIKNHPKFKTKFLKNGKYKLDNSLLFVKFVKNTIPITARMIWIKIFIFEDIPKEFLNFIFL